MAKTCCMALPNPEHPDQQRSTQPGTFLRLRLYTTCENVFFPWGYVYVLQSVRRNRVALTFAICCLWIAAVSVHDAVLVLAHHDVIGQLEQNPLGRWLIQAHGGDVWLFVWLKLAGTALVCAVLVKWYRYRSFVAVAVAAAIACFQSLLLLYLYLR